MSDSPDIDLQSVTAADYSDSVYKWLCQAYQMQVVALGFPSYVAHQTNIALQQQQQQQQSQANSNQQQRIRRPPESFLARLSQIFFPPEPNFPQTHRWVEYRIPPVWKRIVAELIDFLFLMAVKISITFLAVDWFDFIDFDKYDDLFNSITSGKDLDLDTAVLLTQDVIYLEILHRTAVCGFEVVCTYTGTRDRPGGATPGKLFMGLRIFKCEQVIMTAEPSRVQITPSGDLGFFYALIRSVLKNLSMAFFFPICLTLFILPYNRTAYDIFSRSIVVEVDRPIENPVRQQRN